MPDLWVVVHRGAPLAAFVDLSEAKRELNHMLADKSDVTGDVWIEPFDVIVGPESSRRADA